MEASRAAASGYESTKGRCAPQMDATWSHSGDTIISPRATKLDEPVARCKKPSLTDFGHQNSFHQRWNGGFDKEAYCPGTQRHAQWTKALREG